MPFLYVFTFNRLEIAIIAMQNLSNGVNVIREGAPSRIRMVLLISLGMTTRPRSSILRTIPVAFIYKNLLVLQICAVSICKIRAIILDLWFSL